MTGADATPTGGDERLARLLRLLAEKGGRFVEPPVLHPLRTFVDLAGEDFRRRLFTTAGLDGEELALRPDYTIAVALQHLAGDPAPGTPARYAYCGPVFRQRRQTGDPEFLQAGVEWIGLGSGAAADAGVLGLALEVSRALDLPPLALKVGEADLFAAVVDRLGLPAHTAVKLKRGFGDRERLDRLLALLAAPDGDAPTGRVAGLAAALSRLEPDEARRVVAAVVEVSAGTAFGGRSPGEIAERILSRTRSNGGGGEAVRLIADYLALAAPLAEAPERLSGFFRGAGLSLDGEAERLARFVDALAAAGIDTTVARFEAGFGRRLDYYTGFVFELHDPARPGDGPLIGGGRYDRLLALLGAGAAVPGVGFAIWLDKLGYRPSARVPLVGRP